MALPAVPSYRLCTRSSLLATGDESHQTTVGEEASAARWTGVPAEGCDEGSALD